MHFTIQNLLWLSVSVALGTLPWATALVVGQDKNPVAAEINAVLSDAKHRRQEAMRKADREYRVAVSETLRLADRVEVFLLDFSMGRDPAFEPKDDDGVFE